MFKWVVQTKIKSIENLLKELIRQNVDFFSVDVLPFSDNITPDLDISGDVYVYGSTTLGNIAKKKGWTYFDENLDIEILNKNYGDLMLNKNSNIFLLKDVETDLELFFIRPCEDRKEFSGHIISNSDFKIWLKELQKIDGYSTLPLDTRVVIAPVVDIYSEYRFAIVNGKIVTYSQYRQGDQKCLKSDVAVEVIQFVQNAIDLWRPNPAFVIDVANTSNGWKIIECNSINSSGFYEMDLSKYVSSIQELKNELD